MEIGKTRLALTASALAMALMLAGCGGSSSSGGVSSAGGGGSGGTTPTVTPEPDTPEPTSGEQANTLFSQANDAESDAEDALEMATEARATAKKMAGMLDVISVAGNSKTAMDNAQAILDAKAKVATELANAENALADAEAAQTAANALPADTPELASLKAEAKEAVDAAKGAIAAIEAIQEDLGPGTLAAYVYAVEGSDGKGTPTKTGEGIAKMIGPALGPTSADNGSPMRGGLSTAAPPTKAVATILGTGDDARAGNTPRVLMHDAPARAMTWAEIVGKNKVADKVFGGNQAEVSVTSVAGMDASMFTVGTDAEPAALVLGTTQDIADGSLESVNHMGIPGTLYCVGGTGCSVDADGKLKGKLYFGATDIDQRYTRAPNVNVYSAYDQYATYGYWLSQATNGDVTVNTFAGQSDDRGPVTAENTGVLVASDTLADSATYEGKAIGMSMMKSFDGTTGKEMGHKSGEFEAMVTLTAEFNATPKLSGKIDQFVGVGASSAWSVTLQEENLNDTAGTITTGVAQGSGTTDRAAAGTWTANTYGEADKRPTGIFGGFNAHFDNGHAAGAYATRMKQ